MRVGRLGVRNAHGDGGRSAPTLSKFHAWIRRTASLFIGVVYENRENKAETNIEENPLYVELKTAYENLERENTAYIEAMTELRSDYNHLNSQVEYHNDMIKGKIDNRIVLSISPAVAELLELVRERVSKVENRELAYEDILLTPFVRYKGYNAFFAVKNN